MTARPRNSGSGQPELPAMELRRVRVRRDGYDASGTYWGAGPVTFVTAWLDREAHSKDWQKRQAVRAQGDLFQWADANTEVGKRKPTTKAKRPMVDPAQRRSKRRDPA